MSFKAKIQRLASASSADVCKLIQWLNISKTSVDTANPFLQLATVTDERNTIVGCVPFESVFLVNADSVAQSTSPSNDLPAGNVAAGAIERAAREQGVGKVLLILADHHPSWPGEKWVRIIEQPITSTAPKMPEVKRDLQHQSIFIN